MKEFDALNDKLNDEIREERQEIKQLELRGELLVPRGHTVYYVDLTTLIVRRKTFKQENTLDMLRGDVEGTETGTIIKGKIEHNDNHIVFTALNDKNAVRKIRIQVKDLGENPELVKFEK